MKKVHISVHFFYRFRARRASRSGGIAMRFPSGKKTLKAQVRLPCPEALSFRQKAFHLSAQRK